MTRDYRRLVCVEVFGGVQMPGCFSACDNAHQRLAIRRKKLIGTNHGQMVESVAVN